jgi:hypothetical protein
MLTFSTNISQLYIKWNMSILKVVWKWPENKIQSHDDNLDLGATYKQGFKTWLPRTEFSSSFIRLKI